MADNFKIVLTNRFQALQEENADTSANRLYQNFEKACSLAAGEVIPVKKRTKRIAPWESEHILMKRNCLNSALERKNQNPSRENRYHYRAALSDLKQTYQSEQEQYVKEMINEIESAAINKQAALAWKSINEVTGRKSCNRAKLKATDQNERIRKWKMHFENLLGKAPVITEKETTRIVVGELNIKKGNFSMEELKTAKRNIKRGKACGLDNIPSEVWLTGDYDNELLNFCNSVYQHEPIDKWRQGCILPFPKKGDLGLTSNYRGITLTAIAAKI